MWKFGTPSLEGPVWWDVHNEEYMARSLGSSEIHTAKVGSFKGCAIFFLLAPNYSVNPRETFSLS